MPASLNLVSQVTQKKLYVGHLLPSESETIRHRNVTVAKYATSHARKKNAGQ